MLGIAQKMFYERTGKVPNLAVRWPMINSLLDAGCSLYLEEAFAKDLLVQHPQATEKNALFLAYLLLSARQGHLCISTQANTLSPSPSSIFNEIVPIDYPKFDSSLDQAVWEGAQSLPPGLNNIVISGSNIYLRRFWNDETVVIEQFKRLLQAQPSSVSTASIGLGQLNDEQRNAVHHACSNCVTLVTGGPGTGKTFTAACLINALSGSVKEMVAAAPTGKAAANLSTKLGEGKVIAKTLHSLLGTYKRNETDTMLSADLIIVDECSMIDVQMMASLLKAIKTGARLVMLGDSNQLPSVEAGGIFSDLVYASPKNCVQLNKCLRTESSDILHFADQIRRGRCEVSEYQDITLTSWPEKDAIIWDLIKEYCAPFSYGSLNNLESLFTTINQRRILTPLREGPWGVKDINRRLMDFFSHVSQAPIIVTATDYSQNLFNGDVGILINRSYALFQTPKGLRRIEEQLLPRYEYAYALSVHKSQGSEFNDILLLLPPRSEAFGREVIYTGVTRARKKVHLVTSDQTLQNILKRQMVRHSGIRDRM